MAVTVLLQTSRERTEKNHVAGINRIILLESCRTQKEKVAMEYLDVTKIIKK